MDDTGKLCLEIAISDEERGYYINMILCNYF